MYQNKIKSSSKNLETSLGGNFGGSVPEGDLTYQESDFSSQKFQQKIFNYSAQREEIPIDTYKQEIDLSKNENGFLLTSSLTSSNL